MLTNDSRLRDFPALAGQTYLNTAAESIPPRCTGIAIENYWQDKLQGMRGREGHFAQVEACREISAKTLGLQPAEVAFCSCASEAYNLLATALQLDHRDEVVVTDLDFPAGVSPWLRAASPPGLRLWKSVEGALVPSDLEPLLNERTRLVQVSLVSFYNGHRIAWPALRETVRRLAPNALISADITQAVGRVVLDCQDADIQISSTHKWTLGIHGGCIIGVPTASAARLTTHAGGWLHLKNAFESNRFEHAETRSGAASFSVGMPNFVALYALNASLRYLDQVGIAAIAAHSDPLVQLAETGLRTLGIQPLCRWNGTGIVAFTHSRSAEIHAALERQNIHVMHNAGRIRIAVHGYNTADDVHRFLRVLGDLLDEPSLREIRPRP
jgi:cysteine desulfurase/selenocysteine lyase